MNRIDDNLVHWAPNERIVEAFEARHVDYVVIGGLAVSWYVRSRRPDDMDLMVSPDPENSKRLAYALSDLGITGFVPNSFSKLSVRIPIKKEGGYYAELLTPKAGGPSFTDVYHSATDGKLFGHRVRIASRELLIRMKRIAVEANPNEAQKHEEDIKLLESSASA